MCCKRLLSSQTSSMYGSSRSYSDSNTCVPYTCVSYTYHYLLLLPSSSEFHMTPFILRLPVVRICELAEPLRFRSVRMSPTTTVPPLSFSGTKRKQIDSIVIVTARLKEPALTFSAPRNPARGLHTKRACVSLVSAKRRHDCSSRGSNDDTHQDRFVYASTAS